MKLFFVRCIDRAQFAPKTLIILADSEDEAKAIAIMEHGEEEYVVDGEQELEKGVVDSQY